MAAPRSGGIPPLFWIIIAGLVVMVAVAAFLYGGVRQGVGANVDTPVNRELGEPPSVRPPDAMPGSPTVPSTTQQNVPVEGPSDGEVPPTGGTPLPLSDPDAD